MERSIKKQMHETERRYNEMVYTRRHSESLIDRCMFVLVYVDCYQSHSSPGRFLGYRYLNLGFLYICLLFKKSIFLQNKG